MENLDLLILKFKEVKEELEKAISSRSVVSQMKGGGATELTHPSDMSRAHMLDAALHGAYNPSSTPKATPVAPKLTGMDRIKAVSQQPISKTDLLKQCTSAKKHENKPFEKTVNQSYDSRQNEGMAMSCGEKLSLNKAGQWNISGMPKNTVAKKEDKREGVLIDKSDGPGDVGSC